MRVATTLADEMYTKTLIKTFPLQKPQLGIFYCLIREMASKLAEVKDVDIDPDGVFKYILIKVHEDVTPPVDKNIVRGYKRCTYHSDIYDDVDERELSRLDLHGECLGGGRIQHDASGKNIKVYGYSQGYGKADHKVAVGLLQKVYPGYNITWSDEGY